jgi:hypothetical protein
MTATVAAPVVADGVGPNLFRNLAADKNLSYALSSFPCYPRESRTNCHSSASLFIYHHELSRGNRGNTAKLLGNFALLHTHCIIISILGARIRKIQQKVDRDNARRVRMEMYGDALEY